MHVSYCAHIRSMLPAFDLGLLVEYVHQIDNMHE